MKKNGPPGQPMPGHPQDDMKKPGGMTPGAIPGGAMKGGPGVGMGGPPGDGDLKGGPAGDLKGGPGGPPGGGAMKGGPGMMMGGMPGGPPQGPLPWKRLYRWAWRICMITPWGFWLASIASLASAVLMQYSIQVLATAVSGISGSAPKVEDVADATAAAAPAAEATAGGLGGLMNSLMPQDPRSAAILFTVLSILIVVMRVAERLLNVWSDNRMVGALQKLLHDKLVNRDSAYHNAHDLGEKSMIVTRYAQGTQVLLKSLISFPFVQGIGLLTAVFFLLANVSQLGDVPVWLQVLVVLCLIGMPLIGLRLSRRMQAAYTIARDSETAVANVLANSFHAPGELQIMNAQPVRGEAMKQAVDRDVEAKTKAAIRNEMASQFQSTMPVLLQLVFLVYGVFVAIQFGNRAAAGAILAIYYFVPQITSPIQGVMGFIGGIRSSMPLVSSVIEALEYDDNTGDEPRTAALPEGPWTVRFDHVTFGYNPDERLILKDQSFELKPNTTVAIVALSGMGKSSVLNLLMDLYRPQHGQILLNDTSIHTIPQDVLRREIVRVSQFPLFINGTLRDNFHLAKADATDAEIIAAMTESGFITEIVQRKHPGLSSEEILELACSRTTGTLWSGGETKFMAIARAHLLSPRIMLIDEPTSGVDGQTLGSIRKAIELAKRKHSVVLVDHEIEAFIHLVADQVLCLQDGVFTDRGTPAELYDRCTLYRKLYEKNDDFQPTAEMK